MEPNLDAERLQQAGLLPTEGKRHKGMDFGGPKQIQLYRESAACELRGDLLQDACYGICTLSTTLLEDVCGATRIGKPANTIEPLRPPDQLDSQMIDRRQALKLMLATPVLSYLALGQPPQADPFTDKISSAMQGFVADGKLVCAVGFVFQRGRLLYEDAVGYSDLAAKTPIRTDAIFDVRSISKPLTAIGVMVLVDSGKISLNDPIDRYLPEFRNVKVNSSGGLISPKRPPTIFDLLTDTAGINAQLNESLTRSFALPLKEAVNLYATHPLEFEPDQKWEYSSAGFAVLGRIIEVVSKQPFQRFMHERVFSAIGMQDSFFFPPGDKVSRIPLMYILENGRMRRDALDVTRKGQLYAAPEFGLCTTGRDLENLAQVFLNDGLSSGKRFLSSRAIRMMITRQVPTNDPSLDMGLSWFCIRRRMRPVPIRQQWGALVRRELLVAFSGLILRKRSLESS